LPIPSRTHKTLNFFLRKKEGFIWTSQEISRKGAAPPKEASTNWVTIEPHLRLIYAIAHDKARAAMAYKDLTLDRSSLDARKNADRPKTWEEVVADLFNDDSLVFTTDVIPELYYSFTYARDLYFQDVPGGAITPD
jgi:hypothetical protein